MNGGVFSSAGHGECLCACSPCRARRLRSVVEPAWGGAGDAEYLGGISGCSAYRAGSNAAQASRAAMPPLKTNFWFTVIFLIYAVDWADRSLISAVLPSIKEEFGLSDAKVGMMSGFLFIGLGLLAVPTGLLVDRFSRKYMIVIMTSVWSAAIWSMGMATSFAGLAISRLGVGAGEAGYNPAGYALISAWYPRRIRGLMVGIFNIAQPLGGGLGAVLAGWITFHYGWRSVFGIMAIPGFILAALMLFAPDYKTVKADGGSRAWARRTPAKPSRSSSRTTRSCSFSLPSCRSCFTSMPGRPGQRRSLCGRSTLTSGMQRACLPWQRSSCRSGRRFVDGSAIGLREATPRDVLRRR